MSRYTAKDDRWIVEYFGAVPTRDIAEDLGRSVKSVADRAAKLHSTGAWQAYEAAKVATIRAEVLAGHLDLEMMETVHNLSPADLGLEVAS